MAQNGPREYLELGSGITNQNYDMLELCKQGLLQKIKGQIESELTAELVAPYENRIRDIIRANLKSVTLDSIKSFRDMALMQDRMLVHIIVDNETTEHTV